MKTFRYFLCLLNPNLIQKIRKRNDLILKSGITDGRTDRDEFVGPSGRTRGPNKVKQRIKKIREEKMLDELIILFIFHSTREKWGGQLKT